MADRPELTDVFRRAVQANVDYYQGWLNLSLQYLRGISEIFMTPEEGRGSADVDSGTGTLVLEGEEGETARGTFLVSNDLERSVSCELVASAFKDPDGETVKGKVAFEPAKLKLEPGEQRVVQATVVIDRKLTAGLGYEGEFSIKGMDGFAVPVVLRRRHRAAEPAAEQPQDVLRDAAKPKARKAARKKATKKTVKKKAVKKKTAAAKKAGKRKA